MFSIILVNKHLYEMYEPISALFSISYRNQSVIKLKFECWNQFEKSDLDFRDFLDVIVSFHVLC